MPRAARKKSTLGIYHIMLRGINRQQIFEDDEDKMRFIAVLEECKKISKFELYAYCLMGNHIHLLLKVKKEDLKLIFKRMGAKYVYWYNWKYKRVGHLFQDRFKSEAIEDEKYLLTVIKYIHQNPLKAKLCETLGEYKWSSYNDYINKSIRIDSRAIFQLIDTAEFIEFHKIESVERCLEYEEKEFSLTDLEAMEIIKKISGLNNSNFQRLEKDMRNKYIKELKNEGLSIRQIVRLTGISFAIVRHV